MSYAQGSLYRIVSKTVAESVWKCFDVSKRTFYFLIWAAAAAAAAANFSEP